eukprot:m.206152 g.206152  ORF g.206152 m.206152 type:complete len:315 (-) comp13754_c1_seq20:1883-2827(-)
MRYDLITHTHTYILIILLLLQFFVVVFCPLLNSFYSMYCLSQYSNSETPLLAIPSELAHRITTDSPLFGLTRADLEAKMAEIVLVLNGEIANLGLTVELRSSFLPREILFNHRFQQVCFRQVDGSCWTDWSSFDRVLSEAHEIPLEMSHHQQQVNLAPLQAKMTTIHAHNSRIFEEQKSNSSMVKSREIEVEPLDDVDDDTEHEDMSKLKDILGHLNKRKGKHLDVPDESDRPRANSLINQRGVLKFVKVFDGMSDVEDELVEDGDDCNAGDEDNSSCNVCTDQKDVNNHKNHTVYASTKGVDDGGDSINITTI